MVHPLSRRFVFLSAALVLLMGCRLHQPPRVVDLTGPWVLYIDGDSYRQGIEILQIQSGAVCSIRSLPTRDWAGARADLLPVLAGTCAREGRDLVWRMDLRGGQMATLRYRLFGDTLRGTLAAPGIPGDHPALVIGMRVSPRILPGRPDSTTRPVASHAKDSTPVVLLRLDDGLGTDRQFIHRLEARRLPAELAVPTARVGESGKLSWDDLAVWRRHGFEPVSHSRFHERTRGTPLLFLAEVLGSLGDLAAHGYDNGVFAQPGSWWDSLNFDSPAKLANWRGSLLRTFTTVTEAYARPWTVPLPLADSMALGLGHYTISNDASGSRILRVWREAAQPGRFSVLLVHTWSLRTPDQLDWFLDTLANAQRAGRIRLVTSSSSVRRLPFAISSASEGAASGRIAPAPAPRTNATGANR